MNKPSISADDIELLAAWRMGDKAAGSVLFDRYFNRLYRFFANKLSATTNIEDLIQETFLACIEGRDRFRGDASFCTYVYAIAKHLLYRECRANTERNRMLDFASMSLQDLGLTPTGFLAKNDQEKLLLLALRNIPLDFQIAIELYYWEGLSGPDLALVLDVPEGTVRSRLRRGLQQLRKQISVMSNSTGHLESTFSDLEKWALSLREQITPENAGARIVPRP